MVDRDTCGGDSISDGCKAAPTPGESEYNARDGKAICRDYQRRGVALGVADENRSGGYCQNANGDDYYGEEARLFHEIPHISKKPYQIR